MLEVLLIIFMIKFIADKNRKLSKLALYYSQDLSFGMLQKLLRKKDVKVNGKRVSEDVSLSIGDVVEIFYTPIKVDKFFEIYKDQNVLVVDKKSGVTSEALYEDLLQTYKDLRFLHRLDRNTAGIMIFAFNQLAEDSILTGFKQRTFDKKYTAQVYGIPKQKQAILTAYLKKDADNSFVKIFDKNVDGSVMIKTGYEVIKTLEDSSVLLVTLYTGKTHQIRAHLAHIGHFIIGDGKYGNNEINKIFKAKSQRLISSKLTLHFLKDDYLSYLDGRSFESKQEI